MLSEDTGLQERIFSLLQQEKFGLAGDSCALFAREAGKHPA